ncbi:1861_t:CDS:10 [Dentiscutata erythropus]|uniref:Exocyst complex component Sec8 n=1 Tax=Dentiscutata erythropus TaxID=1348616 RepID=A0A9N9CQC2_9GLOM|nr:1861_t:CDS:10 [Dentiscutata erythropus]
MANYPGANYFGGDYGVNYSGGNYDDEFDWKNSYSQNTQINSVPVDSFREMEAVMRQINEKWDFMNSENFNPVSLALQLLDDSSLGKDYKAFQQTKASLDRALQFIVNDYYHGFNSSIGTFGGVMKNIGDSQERVREMKSQLKACKEALLSKRSDLLQLWFRSQQYKEMIRILDLIEDFKGAPEKLEGLLREKHFLTASNLLLESTRMLEKKEMIGISALSDLRRYFKAQQSSLHEHLIEELHNHLYLKSSYCDSRWVKYTKDQKELPSPLMEWNSGRDNRKMNYIGAKNKKNLYVNTTGSSGVIMSPRSPKPFINIKDEDDEIITENLDINPETDSFYYMEILIESLAVLKRLPQALETITQRIPIELYQLVDKTVAEVEERNANSFVTLANKYDMTDVFSLESPENDAQLEALRDLLWTLYSKLDAVLQGHRFILDVVERINKIRTLLRDYITDDERDSASIDAPDAILQDLMKEKKSRDSSKQLFKFGDADLNSYAAFDQQYETDIKMTLQKSLPETFSKAPDERQLSVFVIDRFANTNITAGHRLVVNPDAFNVSVLFKPTSAFLEKVKTMLPPSDHRSSEDFTTFLDDFVSNVFLPQIGDKIFEFFHKATSEADAFQEDPNYKSYTTLPVVKSAASLMIIVERLCVMLQTMASHKEEFSKMIISLLTRYYVKCFERYQAIVSKNSGEADSRGTGNHQGISATWVQQDQLSEILGQYPYLDDDTVKSRRRRKLLCDKETKVEMHLKKKRYIRTGELIMENKKMTALGALYHSLKWFVAKIWELRGKGSKPTNLTATKTDDTTKMDDGKLAKRNRRWSQFGEINPNLEPKDDEKKKDEDQNTGLSLTDEMTNRFDALLATFQQLAEQCLFTLRVELRCHIMHYIDLAMREGNYQLDYEAYEPDPHVLILNTDMVKFEESISSNLPLKEHRFVFEGLDALMEHVLVSNATYIRNLNSNGITKMSRNILALQQNLKNIVDMPGEISLDKARIYYELYNTGPTNVLAQIREQGAIFSFDEYKTMLEIMHKIDPTLDAQQLTATNRRDSPSANRKLYNEHLLELNELMLDFL